MTEALAAPAERAKRGISDALARLSVGLESAADRMEDFDRSLGAAEERMCGCGFFVGQEKKARLIRRAFRGKVVG